MGAQVTRAGSWARCWGSNLKLTQRKKQMTLEDEIRIYLNMCHGNAWRISAPNPPDEPALVSAFLSNETYLGLRDILRKYVSPSTKVLVRGIFTHQTPKVLIKGKKKSVEIGDLLIVHQHFSSQLKPASGRAILFQAKKTRTSRTGSLANGTEEIQFELYQSWPEFTGETRLDRQPDKVTPSWNFQNPSVNAQSATEGAEYLTIFKGHAYCTPFTNPYQWTAAISNGPDFRFVKKNYPNASTWSSGICPPVPSPAKKGVDCKIDFSNTFCDFLLGKKGRSFQPGVVSPTSDHWSLFINQMLSFAFSDKSDYVYKLASQGVVDSRLRGQNLNYLSGVPMLFHAALEEIYEFVAAAAGHTELTNFVLTNEILKHIELGSYIRGRDAADVPPVNRIQDSPSNLPSSHVPLLLVMTHGPDETPFNSQK